MDYLFKFIKDKIKKIDDFSFDDHNFDFLNDFFKEYRLVNADTLRNADRARLITVFIISLNPDMDADYVYDFVSSNEEGFLNMSKKHLDLIRKCIEDDTLFTRCRQLFSFFKGDNDVYHNILKFYKENGIGIETLTINVSINKMKEDFSLSNNVISALGEAHNIQINNNKRNKIIKEFYKDDILVNNLHVLFSDIRSMYEEDLKNRNRLYKEHNRLKKSYEDLLSYMKKAVSKGAIIEYNDGMFGKIKDVDFKKIVLKYIYIYNKEIYDNVNSRYMNLINNSLLSYSRLLDSYGISVDHDSLIIITERNSVDDLDIMIKTLKLKGFDISTISMIIQVSSLSTIKYLVSLIEKGIINKDLLLSDLNLFNKDSSVYKNFVSILNMFEDKKINPNFFQGSQHIYLIDKNIIEENINILIEYKLFNFLKCGGYYSFFNSFNLRDSINTLRSLKLDSYLVNDLTILNYSSRFNRLEVLNVLNVSISSYDELLSYLTDDNFFIPDSMIPSYLSDTSFSKSL